MKRFFRLSCASRNWYRMWGIVRYSRHLSNYKCASFLLSLYVVLTHVCATRKIRNTHTHKQMCSWNYFITETNDIRRCTRRTMDHVSDPLPAELQQSRVVKIFFSKSGQIDFLHEWRFDVKVSTLQVFLFFLNKKTSGEKQFAKPSQRNCSQSHITRRAISTQCRNFQLFGATIWSGKSQIIYILSSHGTSINLNLVDWDEMIESWIDNKLQMRHSFANVELLWLQRSFHRFQFWNKKIYWR